MQLSVVVPVHNEGENIAPLIDEIVAALTGREDYEIIYVNDGSRDDTAARLAEAATRLPQLRVITHARACGQSTAVATGIRHARGRWIATLDGDGQNDPADIPKLLAVLTDPTRPLKRVMAAGYRRKRQDTWIKRISSKIANGVRSRLLGDATPDTGCGLKVFERAVFLELPYFDHMHRFLPALVRRAGYELVSVEVNHRHRTRGVSKYGTLDRLAVGIVDLFGVMWLQRRARVPEIE
ncbi:glycosyltransferase family 2 protein [Plasticicumulans sp.]|uniref:glycosyltransferase family 2 protein n=1 Tax=Plasticicumulans sp. TaxID=2307179 RepID=UPI002C91F45B|nr:glycosyltransferase family 2 protein [Plasticicumulans sp.]MBS0600772.1 glycosyltransferase family 2 protein [Pseudomonadota bacterium]HMV40018.1 glycosyltransferase family 2 protein [Plasticicumulans sp.]HMW28288.1 glycosyltransferase family 2 protein [Plasticicumulans sp.]HMW42729.1 glycosyltransferase family 2 protein [Plasticicumulans sp.]HMZ10427.1 glycosyltransferase family 2 protein [Plasticicumulans sp.]